MQTFNTLYCKSQSYSSIHEKIIIILIDGNSLLFANLIFLIFSILMLYGWVDLEEKFIKRFIYLVISHLSIIYL